MEDNDHDEDLPQLVSPNFGYSDSFTLMKQGAEARIYDGMFLGRPTIVKERFAKKYRHPTLDENLTKERMKAEVRCMMKCRSMGIRVPTLFFVDSTVHRIYMAKVCDAVTVKDFIEKETTDVGATGDAGCVEDILAEKLKFLSETVGLCVAAMHSAHVVHGDLTTSNILINPGTREITFIDFGLSSVCQLAEDKGVDLYVLERALISAHANSEKFFADILTSYSNQKSWRKGAKPVLKKLDEIRLRGRKRDMVG